MEVKINIIKEIKRKGSILICGLPGIAYVGKLSIDYLVRELGAELVGEVYSPFFPPYVLIGKEGVVELLRNELHYLNEENERGIFFLTGNAQAASPEGQYYTADKILDAAISFGVKRVYTLAAFVTNKSSERPKVYGVATKPSLVSDIKSYGALPMEQGSISGMNGLIFGLARIKKLEGICLLGETLGYRTPSGHYLVDAKAVKAVLELLSKILDISIDMEPLDKQTEQMDELISRIEEIEKRKSEDIRDAHEKSRTRYIT